MAYRSVTRSYYRGAAGAILVYDITKSVISNHCYGLHTHSLYNSRESFTNLSRWLADARALGSPHLVTVLVGNKSDREEEREVEWGEASRWAAENGMSPVTPLLYITLQENFVQISTFLKHLL